MSHPPSENPPAPRAGCARASLIAPALLVALLIAMAPTLTTYGLGAALRFGSRGTQLWALEQLAPRGRLALPLIAQGLEARDPEVREATAVTLAREFGAAAMPQLLRALDDEDEFLVMTAELEVASLGVAAARDLVRGFDRSEAQYLEEREAAAQSFDPSLPLVCLKLLSELEAEAIPALRAGLSDANPSVRYWSLRGLARRPSEELGGLMPALAPRLLEDDAAIRGRAWTLAERLDPKGETLTALALEALADPQAAAALPDALEALPRLELGARGARLAEPLARRLRGEAPEERWRIAEAIVALGAEAAAAVPILAEELGAADPEQRQLAARILARLGAVARPATSALELARVEEQDEIVRLALKDALAAISSPAAEPPEREAPASGGPASGQPASGQPASGGPASGQPASRPAMGGVGER